MSKRVRILLRVVGRTMTVLSLCAVGWIVINSRDIDPPDTSDLVSAPIEASGDENAYTLFLEAFKLFQWPKDDRKVEAMLPGKKWDEAYVDDLISRNAETLALLKQGLACPAYEPHDEPESSDPRPLWQRNDMSKLMALKAAHDVRTGHAGVAREDCYGLLRFGSLVEANPTSLIDCVVGMVVIGRGLKAVGGLLCELALDEAELVSLSDRLSQTAPLEQGWVKAIKMEYGLISGGIDKAAESTGAKHRVISGYIFQPNRTKADFACFCRTMIKNFSRPYSEMDLPAPEPNPSEGPQKLLLLLRPNGMVKLGMPRPDYLNGFLAGRCRTQSHLDGLRLVVACRLYEMRHGRLPETLDALVPELLGTVPRDPFDGKPFRYSRADAAVYSVGKDLRDSWFLGERAADALLSERTSKKTDDLAYFIHAKTE